MSPSIDARKLHLATDTDLRQLIFTHSHVLVKFVDEDCVICKALAPKMTTLANDARYTHVLFLQIDAAENPVAAKEVGFTSAPFVAAYGHARMLYCESVFSQEGVENILDNYLAPDEVRVVN